MHAKIDLDIILIIGKADCDNCEKAKQFFRNAKKEFVYSEFKDISQPLKRKISSTLKENSLQVAYPFIISGDYIFSGFSKSFWEQLL